MPTYPVIKFSQFSDETSNTLVVLVSQTSEKEAVVSTRSGDLINNGFLAKFIEKSGFNGKFGASASTYLVNEQPERVILLGTGDAAALKNDDWLKLGGAAYAAIGKPDQDVTAKVFLEIEGQAVTAEQAADFALGMQLRAYRFEKYQTKKSEQAGNSAQAVVEVELEVRNPGAAEAAFSELTELGKGVVLARDLVNEPANILGTLEFADEAKKLEQLGVKVSILDEPAMKELGMGALLGVAQGSVRPPRLVVMEWNGGKDGAQPIAFVGKGVVFDTGGISIKPASNMEDMKGDMGGAAAVVGLMRALAGRKAKANIIGVIGLVENMPDGNAQRPGDIVTSMSGQTIEVINTDAEGRLVLADALYYTDKTFSPRFIINLATLTGAIMVALGTEYAGLFSNDDELAQQLAVAGESSGEKVWRMPLSKEYDKIVDSKFADMRNSCGRLAGAVTAAQFLQRFIGETTWAHLDIAGVAMDAGTNEYSRSWATGYGVRLLDRLIRNHYEA